MSLRDDLHRRRDELFAIAARHGVSNLRLFGSAARAEERPDSDIDLLVDLSEDCGFDHYLAFIEELEKTLGRRVDVVIGRSLSPHFGRFIEAEARAL